MLQQAEAQCTLGLGTPYKSVEMTVSARGSTKWRLTGCFLDVGDEPDSQNVSFVDAEQHIAFFFEVWL